MPQDAVPPTFSLTQGACVESRNPNRCCVGEGRHSHTDACELEHHIRDCGQLWAQAYARFQAHHNPHDRDEALLWLHRQNAAILTRSPECKAAREAQIQQAIDQSVGYFIDQGDAARARLVGERGP